MEFQPSSKGKFGFLRFLSIFELFNCYCSTFATLADQLFLKKSSVIYIKKFWKNWNYTKADQNFVIFLLFGFKKCLN